MYTISITDGKITIPIQIRRELDFIKGGKALVSVKEGKIIISPIKKTPKIKI